MCIFSYYGEPSCVISLHIQLEFTLVAVFLTVKCAGRDRPRDLYGRTTTVLWESRVECTKTLIYLHKWVSWIITTSLIQSRHWNLYPINQTALPLYHTGTLVRELHLPSSHVQSINNRAHNIS